MQKLVLCSGSSPDLVTKLIEVYNGRTTLPDKDSRNRCKFSLKAVHVVSIISGTYSFYGNVR